MSCIVEEDSQVSECVIKKKITVPEKRALIRWTAFPSCNGAE